MQKGQIQRGCNNVYFANYLPKVLRNSLKMGHWYRDVLVWNNVRLLTSRTLFYGGLLEICGMTVIYRVLSPIIVW